MQLVHVHILVRISAAVLASAAHPCLHASAGVYPFTTLVSSLISESRLFVVDFLDVEGGEGVRYVGLMCKKSGPIGFSTRWGSSAWRRGSFFSFLFSVSRTDISVSRSFWKHIYREPARFTSGFGADICVRDKHKAWAIVNRAEHDSQMDMWTRIVRQHCFDF